MSDPVVHFEIISADATNLHRFYGGIFGWKIDASNPMAYGMVDTQTPGLGIGGGIGAPMPGGQGHFTVYIQVADIDAALARVIAEGGTLAMPRTAVPGGPTIAQFFDPVGNRIGLIESFVVARPMPKAVKPKAKAKPKAKPKAKKVAAKSAAKSVAKSKAKAAGAKKKKKKSRR